MKLKNNKKWHQEKEFENLFFFAQRFDELFFDYTLDTYKPAALNSAFLCREAINLIDDIEDDILDSANLSYVIEELEWALNQDIISKLMLNAPVKKFILFGDGVKLSDTKTRLEVLERTLNPIGYIEVCQMALKEEFNGGSKKRIESIIKSYSSALTNIGISKQHLYENTQRFFFYGDEIQSIDDVDNFFYLISPTVHNFEQYFIVSSLINEVKDSISTFGLNILEDLPENAKALAEESNITLTEDEVWIEIDEIETYDRHTARKRAESRLDMVRDLFLLFSHKNRIHWRDEAIITQCCDEQPIVIRKPKNTMEKCFDLKPNDASKRLNSLISNIGLMNESFIKFHRAVDLHGIGTTNELPENQLLNIWIALETLVPSHAHGGGKVVNICNALMPVLLKNYLTRIIQRLAGDLVRWNRSKTSSILRKLPNSGGKNLYQKVLELTALEEHQELRNEFYSELGNFYLLRFRLFELSELFKKPGNLLRRIELHEKKVAWQIRRIYRTRNLIVHSGRSIPYIDTLIENAHDYLDQAMNNVIHYSCGILDAESIDQAFDMAKLDYEVYLSELKEIEEFDCENIDFIANLA